MYILVVDDEHAIASLFEDYIESVCGHEVDVVHSGSEALASVARRSPDLIILDVVMPGMDGYEVAQALRNDPKTSAIPILVSSISCASMSEHEQEQKRLGLAGFLTKPIDFRKLVATINKVGSGVYQMETVILLVDDDEKNIAQVLEQLKQFDCKTEVVRDVDNAAKKAAEICPDMVVMNYLMSVRSGRDIGKELKENPKTSEVPVLLISSYVTPTTLERRIVSFYEEKSVHSSRAVQELCKKIRDLFAKNSKPS